MIAEVVPIIMKIKGVGLKAEERFSGESASVCALGLRCGRPTEVNRMRSEVVHFFPGFKK